MTQVIVNGPGKFDLAQSLFDGKVIAFSLKNGEQVKGIINSIKTDIDRVELTITGTCYGDGRHRSFKALYISGEVKGGEIELI